jgi:hypothetical protein
VLELTPSALWARYDQDTELPPDADHEQHETQLSQPVKDRKNALGKSQPVASGANAPSKDEPRRTDREGRTENDADGYLTDDSRPPRTGSQISHHMRRWQHHCHSEKEVAGRAQERLLLNNRFPLWRHSTDRS